MNLIQTLEKEQVDHLSATKTIPDFEPGDTLVVNVKVVEGERTRVQAYEGVCIARAGAGISQNFTVRKISYGEGVERVFPLYSPMVELDQGRAPRQGAPRQAVLSARPPRQVGAHRRRHPPRLVERGRGCEDRAISLEVSENATRPGSPGLFVWLRRTAPRVNRFVVGNAQGGYILDDVQGFQSPPDRPGRPRSPPRPFFRPADGVGPGGALTAAQAPPRSPPRSHVS